AVYGLLKTVANSVPGWPFWIAPIPESGPKENIYVWFPSASVIIPSPPEICWHLIAPPLSVKVSAGLNVYAPVGSLVAVLTTGPRYGTSALAGLGFTAPPPPVAVVPGCLIVAVGH